MTLFLFHSTCLPTFPKLFLSTPTWLSQPTFHFLIFTGSLFLACFFLENVRLKLGIWGSDLNSRHEHTIFYLKALAYIPMKRHRNNWLNPLQSYKLKPKASQDGCGELGNIEPSFQVNIVSHLMSFEISKGQDCVLPPSRLVKCAGSECLRAFVLPTLYHSLSDSEDRWIWLATQDVKAL